MPKMYSESDFQGSRNLFNENDFLNTQPQQAQISSSLPQSAIQNLGRGFALQPPNSDISLPSRAAYWLGQNAPPAIGGTIGAAGGTLAGFGIGSIPGSAIGGAAARSLQQAAAAYMNPQQSDNPEQVLKNVGESGAVQGLTQGAGEIVSSAAQALKPTAVKIGSQFLKAFPKISENAGRAVLENPNILSQAPTVEEAGKAFNSYFNQIGIKNGAEGSKQVLGKVVTSQGDKLDLLNNALSSLDQGNLDLQTAVVAREQTSKLLQAAKWSNPELAQEQRELTLGIKSLDDFIEKNAPGYADIRQGFRQAKQAEAFSSLFPLNKSGSPDALRSWIAGTVGLSGAAKAIASGNIPAAAGSLAAPLLLSPRFWGTVIRGGNFIGRGIPATGFVGRMAAQGLLTNYQPNPAQESPQTPLGAERGIRNLSNPFKVGQ